jgi:hypothetical protein
MVAWRVADRGSATATNWLLSREDPTRYLRCPVCCDLMCRCTVRDVDVPGLSVDTCDHGVWVDAGQLTAFLRTFLRATWRVAARPWRDLGDLDPSGERTLRLERLGAAAPGIDAEVAELVARGAVDDAAVLVLEAYGPEIQRYLRAVLRDGYAAGDAFAAVAESIWRGIAEPRGDVPLSAWCSRIVLRAAGAMDDLGPVDEDLKAT